MGRRWLIGLVALVAVQLAMLSIYKRIDDGRWRARLPVQGERRADPGHDLLVERSDGGRILVRARSGRYQLVHFWATWCPPCRQELPLLIELARRKRDRVQVWAVSTDREWTSIRGFFSGDVPAVVVRDATAEAARAYGVSGLPDSFLIDPQGRIRARFSGAQNWSGREMDRVLEEVMAES